MDPRALNRLAASREVLLDGGKFGVKSRGRHGRDAMNASLALRRTVRIEITGIVHDIDLSRCESLRQHTDRCALMRLDYRGLVEALPQGGIDINGRHILDLSG